jgi:hypothetical protein
LTKIDRIEIRNANVINKDVRAVFLNFLTIECQSNNRINSNNAKKTFSKTVKTNTNIASDIMNMDCIID